MQEQHLSPVRMWNQCTLPLQEILYVRYQPTILSAWHPEANLADNLKESRSDM